MFDIYTKKIIGTSLLTVISFLLIISFKPSSQSLQESFFWTNKARGGDSFDIVMIGDSRVARGFSPKTFREILPDKKVGNLGFFSAVLEEPYLSFVESRIDKNSSDKIIILGMNPKLLVSLDTKNNEQFKLELNRKSFEVWKIMFTNDYLNILKPVSSKRITTFNSDVEVGYYEEVFYRDGWVHTWMNQNDPKNEVAQYKDFYNKNKISENLKENFLKKVREWVGKGYKVIVLRFPSSKEMYKLEDEISGLDYKIFFEDIRQAGGYFLDLPFYEEYKTYDKEHLFFDSALNFSADIAMILKKEWYKQ